MPRQAVSAPLAGAQTMNRFLASAVAFVVIAISTTSAVADIIYSATVLADNPIAYYRLGEASGPTADNLGTSGNLNDGTYFGTPIFGSSGALLNDNDTAIFFGTTDGDGMVAMPFGSYPSTAISLEVWIRTTQTNASAVFSYAATYPPFGNVSENETILWDPSNLSLRIANSDRPSGVAVNDGDWHHVVATWGSVDGQFQLFKDGKLAFTDSYRAGYTLLPNGAFVIAQEQDTYGGGFEPTQRYVGFLDEAAIYDRILSAGEIAEHYQAASIPEPSTLTCLSTLGLLGAAIGWRRRRKRGGR